MEEAAQRFALPALGRAAERRPIGKMIRRRKRLGIAPDSPASGARCVRRFYYEFKSRERILKPHDKTQHPSTRMIMIITTGLFAKFKLFFCVNGIFDKSNSRKFCSASMLLTCFSFCVQSK